MTMERTTDLEKLRKGAPFTWGKLVALHTIGDFTVASYHGWIYRDSAATRKVEKKLSYHGWIAGDDANTSWRTLDEALANLLAIKYDGRSSQAGRLFMRALTAKK